MARSTSVVPPGPFSIADDSRMSEDYLLSDDVLVDAASPNPLAAARMPGGRWTALAVVPGTGLVHVIPEPNSQSGWDLLPMPSGGAAREVVTAVDGAGVSHAFYQDGAFTYHSSLGSAGTWSVPDQLPAAASLTVASIPLTSQPVAAGVTPAGDLLLGTLDWASGKWQASTVDMNKALVGAEAVLTMIDDQNWTLAAVAGGQLQFFSGQGSTLAAGPFTVTTAHPVTRIHSAYQRSGSVMVMFSDDQNTLYTSFGFSDQVTVIPNATVVQGAAVIDTALPPKIHFYGADQQGRRSCTRPAGTPTRRRCGPRFSRWTRTSPGWPRRRARWRAPRCSRRASIRPCTPWPRIRRPSCGSGHWSSSPPASRTR